MHWDWDGTHPNWIELDAGRKPMASRRRRRLLRMPSWDEWHWLVALLLLAACVVAGLLYSVEGVG